MKETILASVVAISTLSGAYSFEILGVSKIPSVEFPISGKITDGGQQTLELQVPFNNLTNSLKFSDGKTVVTWEIPSWVLVRSVVFGQGEAWFIMWCEDQGAFLPVGVSRISVNDGKGAEMRYFRVDVGGCELRRLTKVSEKQVVVGIAGAGDDLEPKYAPYQGKWVRLEFAISDLNEVSWKDILEKRKQQLLRIP